MSAPAEKPGLDRHLRDEARDACGSRSRMASTTNTGPSSGHVFQLGTKTVTLKKKLQRLLKELERLERPK